MKLGDTYTTTEKIAADTGNTESKKITLSTDTYALGEILEKILYKLEKLR